jgi:tetratricopeptide (TPR) repeat protein
MTLGTPMLGRTLACVCAVALLSLPLAPTDAAAQTDPAPTGAAAVGTVAFHNSGAPEAQDAFLYGLALLHSFEYGSAARAFRSAQEIDPEFVMAYWGEAMTYNHPVWMEQDANAARQVLSRLATTREARLARAPTAREREWLAAIEVLYGDGSKDTRDDAYAEAMNELRRAYPVDPEAAAFYALSLLGTAHEGRDIPTYIRAAAVLEEVLDDHPGHPGIVHYMIHSYDDPIHAPLGLRAARAYAGIAPGAAHAQHMTSHIFVALGMWDEVVAANEIATAVVDRERAAGGQGPRACGHYNFWLEYGYLQQGREADARRLLRECYDVALAATDPDTPDPDNASVASFAQMRARYVVDTGDWHSDVLSWSPPMDGRPFAAVTQAFASGLAAAGRGDVEGAREWLASLAEERSEVEGRIAERGRNDEVAVRTRILELELDAAVSAAGGDLDAAISLAGEAAALEESLPFVFGPPFVDKPSYELLGELLLDAGRAEEAAGAFETAVFRTPGRGAAVRGLERARELADG